MILQRKMGKRTSQRRTDVEEERERENTKRKKEIKRLIAILMEWEREGNTARRAGVFV